MTHAYYRDAQALLLLYDVTNQSSFDNIRAWLSEIRQYAEEDVVIMLLGNKVDKPNRVITKEQGEKLAKVDVTLITLYLKREIYFFTSTTRAF